MSTGNNTPKMFACCRKYQDSICLKLWIMIFVCSLLCFTCFVIETRRSEIMKSKSIKSRQAAQKLIQIKSSFNNDITKSNDIEESSGHYAEDTKISFEQIEAHPIHENELDVDYYETHDSKNCEMLAASNCISKSSDIFTTTQISLIDENNDYGCNDLMEQVEQLLEFPEFSETQVNDVFLDYEADSPAEHHKTNDYEWIHNLEEEDDVLPYDLKEDDDIVYQLSSSESNIPTNWDLEDRFFPDEYAFQAESFEEAFPAEPYSTIQGSNNLLTEKITPSDIPSMIDTFLGKISKFFVPSMHVRKSDYTHLNNFKDIPLNVEGMKLASSQVNPVWKIYSSKPKALHRHSFNSPLSISPRRSRKQNIIKKQRKNELLLPKLLRILREK